MIATDSQDTTTALLRDVHALYTGPLDGVEFPEVNAAALQAEQQRWAAAQAEASAAERALEQALQRLQQARAEVSQRAQRALAYAHIYASEQPALRAQIEALQARDRRASEPSAVEPKRRGRSKKSQNESLLSAPEAEPSAWLAAMSSNESPSATRAPEPQEHTNTHRDLLPEDPQEQSAIAL